MNNYLVHYASPYYDPVKAHEYYEEHKELKGRTNTRSTSYLNDEGKKIWDNVKTNITEEKKAANESAKQSHQEEIKALQEKASTTKTNISNTLKSLNEALSQNLKTDLEKLRSESNQKKYDIEKKRDSEIEALEKEKKKINDSKMSSSAKKMRLASIDKKIATSRNAAANDKYQVTYKTNTDTASKRQDTQTAKTVNSNDAKAQREAVSAELKASVSAARETYKSLKENMKQDYENKYQAEYDKILAAYKKSSKKSTK